ncbi:hypothetical protein ZEAMMB73_Zm00001d016026 [Zea mays]|nr:hypothetical protein ZEAMMB73_Zm00001d016026 [Zea mays]
MGGACG